jgi:hypothetical protein
MTGMGMALMGTGIVKGEHRALEAAQRAISSPLLEETSIQGARGVLINISGGHDLTLHEVAEAARIISDAVDPDANIISGMVIDPTLDEAMKVTVIATGFDHSGEDRPPVRPCRRSTSPVPPRSLIWRPCRSMTEGIGIGRSGSAKSRRRRRWMSPSTGLRNLPALLVSLRSTGSLAAGGPATRRRGERTWQPAFPTARVIFSSCL